MRWKLGLFNSDQNTVWGTSFSDNVSKNIAILTRSHTAGHTFVDENLDNDIDANDWTIKAEEPQAPVDLSIRHYTLKLLDEHMKKQYSQLILATKGSDPSSVFHRDGDRLLHHRNPLIPGLQQIVITHSLKRRLCRMVHPRSLQDTLQ